jgi:cell division protease FtsH
MGGRAAEEIIFKHFTTGASNDLMRASQIAHHMVCNWGMSEDLGPQSFGENQELMFLGREVSRTQDYSEETAKRIDAEVSRLLHDAYESAKSILNNHRDKLEMIATLLLETETIDGRDVEDIVEHGRICSEDERAAQDKERGTDEDDETGTVRSDVPKPQATLRVPA